MDSDLRLRQDGFLSEKFQGSRIMVSGATGLIGSRIVSKLCELNDCHRAGIQVAALYKDEEKKQLVFSAKLNREDISFVRNDITKPLEYSEPVDYVIHCAGISGGSRMHLKKPLLVFDVAYNGTKNMLDFAANHQVKGFCFVSTYEVYGKISRTERIGENEPCRLDTMDLRNIYAECKRMCESMCVAAGATCDMKVSVGRLTSTFGEGVKYDDPRFFAEFARCIIEKRDIVLKSMGNTVRSYLDADDAASAFLYILANGDNDAVYNVTNMDNVISIREMAVRMISLAESNVELRFDVKKNDEKSSFRAEGTTLMDASKLYGLGWSPVYTLDDTLLKLLDCFERGKEK